MCFDAEEDLMAQVVKDTQPPTPPHPENLDSNPNPNPNPTPNRQP